MSQYPYRSEPAWVEGRTAQTAERERAFFQTVYLWMFGGLLVTAAASLLVLKSPALQQIVLGNRWAWLGLTVVEFGLVIFLSARLMKMSLAAAGTAFMAFSLLNGLTLSWIFFYYTRADIGQAFVSAAAMFAVMSVYGMVTKRDLTSMGAFMMMGLLGLIVCSIINIFLRSSAFGWILSVIGVFIFLGLTAWDTQKLKGYAHAAESNKLAIVGALSLYLDFINLFLLLLRIFGGNRR